MSVRTLTRRGLVGLMAALALTALTLTAVSPAQAEPAPRQAASDHGWSPYRTPPFELAAGLRCPFALSGTPVRDRERIRTLATFSDGTPRIQEIVGPLVVRYTNVDSGRSVRRNLTGRALVTYGANGSFVVTLEQGHFAVGLSATDPGGPGFFILTGRGFRLAVAADGSRFLSLGAGRVENLCTTLA